MKEKLTYSENNEKDQFFLINYKVKPGDTLYSLFKKDPYARKYLKVIVHKKLPSIKPGDIISFRYGDGNHSELEINGKHYDLYLYPPIPEKNKEKVRNNKTLEKNILKILNDIFNNNGLTEKDHKLLEKLENQSHKSDYYVLVKFLENGINGNFTLKVIKSYLQPIYTSKKISQEVKGKFAIFLKEYVIGLAGEIENGSYQHDPEKEDQIIDFLEKIAPKYNWSKGIKGDMPLD